MNLLHVLASTRLPSRYGVSHSGEVYPPSDRDMRASNLRMPNRVAHAFTAKVSTPRTLGKEYSITNLDVVRVALSASSIADLARSKHVFEDLILRSLSARNLSLLASVLPDEQRSCM